MAKVAKSAKNPAREAILGAIRAALGRDRLSADAQKELNARVRAHKSSLLPIRGRVKAAAAVEQFILEAEKAACSVDRVSGAAAVPAAVAGYLRQHNLPGDVAAAPDAWLQAMPWQSEPMLNLRPGASEPADLVSITPAFRAVAETGTLVMTSGGEHPTSLNFTPDNHIVVLRRDQVVGNYEAVWSDLRKARKSADQALPRTVNMITGPSRTGDIELTIYLGAHGPRRLHIILIDDDGDDKSTA